MAYNLESLVKILEQNHPHLDPDKKFLIESLLRNARWLKKFFELSSPASVATHEIRSLERRITDAAHHAEDVLESLSGYQIRDLQKVIQDFDSAKEEMKKILDGTLIAGTSSSRSDLNPNNIVVGLNQDLIQLKSRLAGHQSRLDIIPIVGMGGIGKTTLARNLYDDPFAFHFDTRAWVTISQKHDVREIVLGILRCFRGEPTKEMLQHNNAELTLHLYQTLSGRRYLIVLDDMWSCEAWDDIKMFFPDDDNGSRIMVTTRELSVANHAGSEGSHHQMNFLSEAESWNLLRRKVFGEETCLLELEEIGAKIARDCRGLPLAIHVIGGLLSQSDRSQEYWAEVAEDVSRVVADRDEHVSNILSLSYNSLPYFLKPCFLYMAAFPEDYKIRASNLIRLWVAEGFLKPISDKSEEEAAQVYLKALVDRNLILVGEQEKKGNVKSYMIHDLLRDLCIRKANEENFLYVANARIQNLSEVRRVSVHTSDLATDVLSNMKSLMLARSVLFTAVAKPPIDYSYAIFDMQLLKVLNMWMIEWAEFPRQLLKLWNLRYLAFGLSSQLPYSITKMPRLQTLIVRRFAPIYPEVQPIPFSAFYSSLKHVKFKGDYPSSNVLPVEDFLLDADLETLSTVTVDDCFPHFGAVPNLKKLGIFVPHSHSSRIHLTCLTKLETLKCSSVRSSQRDSFLSSLTFPPSLRKLTLRQCTIPLGFMNRLGQRSFPNLEVLKLQNCTMESPTWRPGPTEGEKGELFPLNFLLLEKLNLVRWEADETHFPLLERLIVRDCSKLQEIPSEIGDIPTLETIELHGYSKLSATASARKIRDEQHEMGNDVLQVWINVRTRIG